MTEEVIAPLPVVVPHSRFQAAQQRRHPVVSVAPALTEQTVAADAESAAAAYAVVRSIPVDP